MRIIILRPIALLALGAALGLLLAQSALAQPAAAEALPSVYEKECAACHVAYPPQFLPPASWRALLGSLERHFGTDASLDAGAAQRLAGWLAANADRTLAGPPENRITRSTWFSQEHGDVPRRVRGSKGGMADCASCHPGAAQGQFDEDDVRSQP